jgi:hypothetical protein
LLAARNNLDVKLLQNLKIICNERHKTGCAIGGA